MIHSTPVRGLKFTVFKQDPHLSIFIWNTYDVAPMTIPAIHVHSQADKSTVAYVKFMWETMLAMANHPDLLELTVHCMGPSAADRVSGWVKQGRSIIVPSKKGDPLNGSKGHAVCIMSALAFTGDGKIHVVADSDTVVIAKGWDDYIRNRLVNDGIGMIGTTYEDLGGFSSGANSVQTYKKAPTFTWAALGPMHNWRDLNVMPNKAHHVAITTPLLSEIYNLPQGYSVFGEAAWQIPQYLYDNKLKYEGWRQLKPTKESVVLKGLSDYHEEYHADGTPFVVHHRGSMRHAYRGDKISAKFYTAVDTYLAKEATHEPRWKYTDEGKILTPVAPSVVRVEFNGPKVEVPPEKFVSSGKEWLKITFNGNVVRARKGIDRNIASPQLDFIVPGVDRLGHMRVEGMLEHNFPIVVPPTAKEPYMITVRNMTGAPLMVTNGSGGSVAVPTAKTWWLLVDIDSVQRVE